MFQLAGMNALVTGASGGIGSAIAEALARQGARVALSGSNGAKLRSFREQLIEDVGGEHVEITCNLSDKVQVDLRVISSTSRDLEAEIAAERFRREPGIRMPPPGPRAAPWSSPAPGAARSLRGSPTGSRRPPVARCS